MRASGGFTLQGSPQGRETLVVHPASVASHALGAMAMVVGVVVTGVGVLVTAIFLPIWADQGFQPHSGSDTTNVPGVVGVGAAILGIGAVPLIGGIVLLNQKTKVTKGPAPDQEAAAPWTPWTRAPSWTGALERPMAPAVMGIPLVGGRF